MFHCFANRAVSAESVLRNRKTTSVCETVKKRESYEEGQWRGQRGTGGTREKETGKQKNRELGKRGNKEAGKIKDFIYKT
jgi:hypothetical protein